ncbi:hypothetical protein CHH28_01860 [Bacterioplanes sanyensis]|uniref:Large polyvalent protein-associated domain-containing protein n=1 Tax=Bacterioplanes sanyensis TaxID=1249553 RepID=A0A222FGX2_9GAMM|nr:CLCA_X family protein [Bacterioplanes sanyensis]ASP37493.1 hypothetical protein CHH28_01860 [Bacterioplanes sanyensis]
MAVNLYRRGPDHSHVMAQPDFHGIRQLFGFRSVVIGRWVTPAEGQRAALAFFNALMDLLHILSADERYGLPASLISLRGSLALKYGTGGRPGVAAHYEPATRTFALAKNAGGGSLAHEWFHALDHYLSGKLFAAGPNRFASHLSYLGQTPVVRHPLALDWQQCMDQIFDRTAPLLSASLDYDQQRRLNYYRQPEEMAARAFEAFVEDAAIDNAYLVRGSRHSDEAKAGVYPTGEQRQRINSAFAQYFSNLCQALIRSGE